MEERANNEKLKKLNYFNDESLKLWLIPEIYGWFIVALGFGFFLMLIVAAIALILEEGFSFDSLFSIVLLLEGIAIGGGLIAFGTTLRRFVAVQATLCVIILLVIIWFLYIFLMYGEAIDALKSFLIGLGVMFPLALCVYVNRERLKSKYEPAQVDINENFYELKSKMPPEIYTEILRVSDEGDELFEIGDYPAALEKYRAAFEKIPEPITEHDSATRIKSAIGECYFSSGEFSKAAEEFVKALNFPKALENSFIQLRLGQCLFELGKPERAADFLWQAYKLEGVEIFEDENPKYFEFLKLRFENSSDNEKS